MTAIRAAYLRGGTSKGVFLRAEDLPPAGRERDDLLLRIMGSPDPMQIDGMGGTFSSTSKVIVVEGTSSTSLDYWFAQVGIEDAMVDWSGNCGNLTTAVAPFAIDEGIVAAVEPVTTVRMRNRNTGVVVEATVEVSGGRAATTGPLAIAGVPGAGSPILTRYLEPAGGVLGALLPTGNPIDVIDTASGPIDVSIVDAAHPNVFVSADAVGVELESANPQTLSSDADLLSRIEAIRAAAAVLVGASPTVEDARWIAPAVPRIILVGPDDGDAHLCVLAFSMQKVHRALPMTGALCTGAAARVSGTIVQRAAGDAPATVRIRHPKGVAEVIVDDVDGLRSLGVVRTARRIMDGLVYPREP